MSTILTVPPPPPETKPIIKPVSQPINLLSTPSARTFTHIHPTLLLSYYYLRFPSIVADPVSALFFDLLPLSIFQVTYAITCLPPTKSISSTSTPTPAPKLKPPKKRPHTAHKTWYGELPSKLTTSLLALSLTFLISNPLLTTILVLFGAPLTTHHLHTLLCGAHIALLVTFPLFYVHGVNARLWREIGAAMLPFDSVWGASVGTVLGAWLGAVPIPLDWDREWQKWPVTIVTGAYTGYVVGRFAGEYLLYGKRIKFD